MQWQLAQFPTPTANEFWIFIGCIFTLIAGAVLVLKLINGYRQSRQSDEPKRRILPDPITIRTDDPFVRWSEFREQIERRDREMKSVEQRIEKKIDLHQTYVHDRFHKLHNDLNHIQIAGANRGEALNEKLDQVCDKLLTVCETVEGIRVRTESTGDRITGIETAAAENNKQLQTKVDKIIEREIEDGRRPRR